MGTSMARFKPAPPGRVKKKKVLGDGRRRRQSRNCSVSHGKAGLARGHVKNRRFHLPPKSPAPQHGGKSRPPFLRGNEVCLIDPPAVGWPREKKPHGAELVLLKSAKGWLQVSQERQRGGRPGESSGLLPGPRDQSRGTAKRKKKKAIVPLPSRKDLASLGDFLTKTRR